MSTECTCAMCKGLGKVAIKCPTCLGSGKIIRTVDADEPPPRPKGPGDASGVSEYVQVELKKA